MATTSFTTKFDLTLSPKQFVFVDTTDWAGQGIALADVNSSFKITSPSGVVVYNNTDYTALGCDINTAVSLTNQTAPQLPLGVDGFPEVGVYTIVMTSDDSNLSVQYTKTNTYTYGYTQPVVAITQTAEVVYSPLFTSTDATNYVVNGITPVIVRVHTINYPYGSAGESTPVIGSAATITTSTFYNGTQTTEIESTLTYTFIDGLIVIDFVSGAKELLVDGRIICTIYCCIRATEQQWLAAPANTPTKSALEQKFIIAMSLVGLIGVAPTCGKQADVNGYITSLQTILNCSDDCDCSGDEPTQVTGLGGLVNNVIVESAGSPLTVTPVTVGNTTTYTISFDGTLLTKLNNLYNTVVAQGTNVTVTDSGVVAGVRTFTVNASSPSLSNVSGGEQAALLTASGADTIDTDIEVTVLVSGTYLVLGKFVARQDGGTLESLAIGSYFIIDGVDAVPDHDTSDFGIPTATALLNEFRTISNHAIVSLTAGQTITMLYQASMGGMSVQKRNIDIIKIA